MTVTTEQHLEVSQAGREVKCDTKENAIELFSDICGQAKDGKVELECLKR